MKLLLVAALLVGLPGVVVAAPPTDAVVADLGLHVIGAGLHHTVAPRLVVAADLDYYAPWTQEQHLGLGATALAGAVVRVRALWFLDAAPTGWWVSPLAQAGVGWGVRDGTRHAGAVWAVGAAGGYAWLLGHVTLAVGVGVQYHHAAIPDGSGAPSFAGVWPHADAIVGWAF
jgi:hypothetical protein